MGKWTDLRTKLALYGNEKALIERKLENAISPEKRGRCERRLRKLLNQDIPAIEAQLAQRQPSRVSTPTLAPALRFADHKSFVIAHGIFPE